MERQRRQKSTVCNENRFCVPVRSRERLLVRSRERGIGIILVNVCWFVVDFVKTVLVSFS